GVEHPQKTSLVRLGMHQSNRKGSEETFCQVRGETPHGFRPRIQVKEKIDYEKYRNFGSALAICSDGSRSGYTESRDLSRLHLHAGEFGQQRASLQRQWR